MDDWRGKRAKIIGMGRSGMAAARFLHGQGARVAVSEQSALEGLPQADLQWLREQGIPLETRGHGEVFFADAELIVPSPGIPLDLPVLALARARGVAIIGELALAAPLLRERVIAVTGTNGKTTVTTLIGELLAAGGYQVFVGGNIGNPVLDYLLGPREAEVLVLEVSSFQLDLAGGFRPDVAVLLNLSQDHLERHGSMPAYAAAKARIFLNQGEGDLAVIGEEPGLDMGIGAEVERRVFGFGDSVDARVEEDRIHLASGEGHGRGYELGATRLASRLNLLNTAAALLAIQPFAVAPEKVERALAAFRPLAHRMEAVTTRQGVAWIDDSKATNVGAVIGALENLGGRVILIAGGRDKDSDFRLLRTAMSNKVRYLLLIGEAAAKIEAALGDLVAVERLGSMAAAVQRADALAKAGDTVLLAPACASFDMFRSYGHRGEVFQAEVRALGSGRDGRFAEQAEAGAA